jgi:hypothetical protein
MPSWERRRLERRPFLGKYLVDDALRGRVHARVGNRVEPAAELSIEVIEVAE